MEYGTFYEQYNKDWKHTTQWRANWEEIKNTHNKNRHSPNVPDIGSLVKMIWTNYEQNCWVLMDSQVRSYKKQKKDYLS